MYVFSLLALSFSVLAFYDWGMTLEEALQKLEEAQKTIAELRQQLAAALARVAELEQAQARQAAPFRRRKAKKVPPEEQKPPGRPVGHPGAYRARPPQVDQTVEVPLEGCPRCGGAVHDCQPLVQFIEEIPPLRPVVTRLTTWSGVCAQCGPVASHHPLQTSTAQGAAQTQLGPRAVALGALLNKQLGLTLGRSCAVLKQLTGLSVSRGGLAQALARAARKVAEPYAQLAAQLRRSPAVYADETSWWVGGPGWWLWVFTTPETTLYRVDESRGSAVVLETLGPDYAGVLVSDCLSSYDPPPYRKHKCIAHHLRAIHEARASPGAEDSSYLRRWKLLFQAVLILHRLREKLSAEFFAARVTALRAWLGRLLEEPCAHGAEVRIRNRLAKHVPDLVRCLEEPEVEPTNNRAERALRPAVIARKLSCGNKTEAGRRTWEILASLAATCCQKGEDFVDFLARRIALALPAG